MSELAQRAKERYLEYIAQHGHITLGEFAARSVEFLGERVTPVRVRTWSATYGWMEAAKRIGAHVTDEDEELTGLLRTTYRRAMDADDAKTLAQLVQAYLNLLGQLDDQSILRYYEDDVLALQEHVLAVMETVKNEVKPNVLVAITRSYAKLCRAMPDRTTRLEAEGLDADDVLMGETL